MPDQKPTPTLPVNDESKSTPSVSLGNPGAEPARDVPRALSNLAESVVGEAKKATESQIKSQKEKVVDGLGGVAHALRQATSARNEPVIDSIRPYVAKAADQVDRAAMYMQDRSLRDVAGDLEGLARRDPALFLGGSFVLGLVGGRFLRSKAPPTGSAQAGMPSSASTSSSSPSSASTSTSSTSSSSSGASSSGRGPGPDVEKPEAHGGGKSGKNAPNSPNSPNSPNTRNPGSGSAERDEGSSSNKSARHT